jgi:hypothetical protein
LIDLYNTKDVKETREKLYEDQMKVCALTNAKIDPKDAVLDHDHNTQVVRGVLHRQANAALGKIENVWKRYLSTWYHGDIKRFLMDCHEYLQHEQLYGKKKYYHPAWIKRVCIDFNKLDEKTKESVLKKMKVEGDFKNSTDRKKAFRKAVLTRKYGYDTIRLLLPMKG